MAETVFNRNYLKIMLLVYLWAFQFVIGYLVISLFLGTGSPVYTVSATNLQPNASNPITQQSPRNLESNDGEIAQACADCRLVSQSIQELINEPRQMNSYGQVQDKIDLDKIKKRICRDVVEDHERERCRSYFFRHIGIVEKWKRSNTKTTFFDFVCIKELKQCCPRSSYGSKCSKCAKCQTNQHCHGEGTRTGNGSCVCKEGYTGAKCMSCLPGFYQDQNKQESSAFSCKPCHKSCVYCRSEGSLGCEVCRKGFTWVARYGCSDIDECHTQPKICGDNTFCVNTEGSYFCYECDRGCDGCHGDGPDMCLKCAKGYKLENGNCVALKQTVLPPEANYYRYAIYTGLCICTCIILHSNVYLASLVGLGVALYIGFCEYIMSQHTQEVAFKTGVL